MVAAAGAADCTGEGGVRVYRRCVYISIYKRTN